MRRCKHVLQRVSSRHANAVFHPNPRGICAISEGSHKQLHPQNGKDELEREDDAKDVDDSRQGFVERFEHKAHPRAAGEQAERPQHA